MKTEYEAQLARSESGRDFGGELIVVQQQLNSIEKIISADETLVGKLQESILEHLHALSAENRIKITEVPSPISYPQAGYDIITTQTELEGDYLGLVKLIQAMEQQFERAKIASVRFYTRKNRLNNQKKLYAKIYFQNIKKT